VRRDLGYIEGQNILIESRYAEGRADRLPNLAAGLVHLKVDVLVIEGNAGINAGRNATKTIPIVMAPSGDPLGAGFVASLARPGGNSLGTVSLNIWNILPDSTGYSITWSARCSSDCGIVRPRAFAVLRLNTSSNLVGCSTGRSAGFAPFRILSTKIAARR
jgi:ABC transporter substrate binding protein